MKGINNIFNSWFYDKGIKYMDMNVTLRNYSNYNQYILWNHHTYITIIKDKLDRPIQGIVGYTENKEIIGIYTKNSEVFFLNNEKEYKIDIPNFKCFNIYIDVNTRYFKIENCGVIIFESLYEPYIDPGVIIYDVDPEEFDFLLFLSNNILSDKETLENFIISIEKEF